MPLVTKERPIIFSTEMVRALLDGRKTQTRRLIKGQDLNLIGIQPETAKRSIAYGRPEVNDLCRYGKTGDRLWVREQINCYDGNTLPKQEPPDFDGNLNNYGCEYASVARENICPTSVVSPIYMPRWCCGIELVVTEVSIERLTDISEEDAIAEGLIVTNLGTAKFYKFSEHGNDYMDAIAAYYSLWNSINTKAGTRACDKPWVWVLKFDVDILNN